MGSPRSVDYCVRRILSDQLGSPIAIADEDMLVSDLGCDSVDSIEILNAIEREFSFEIPTHDADKWRTVGDVTRYVRSKLPIVFCQADVDLIVARAKDLGAGAGLTYKHGHLQLSSYGEPHGPEVLAMLLINGWHEKYDLIHATHALIEFLSGERRTF